MLTIASGRLRRILALLLIALTGCAGQLFAASCDQALVSFQAGQLTIFSNGCSLQQVLAAVGRQTAIETQVPASASAMPVFANLGPGDPRRVVSALLDGIPFNWSLAIKADESGSLVRVVLIERSAPWEPASASGAAAQAAPAPKANAAESGKLMAGQAPPDKKRETAKDKEATTEASTSGDQQSDQLKRGIDDSTLSKLPPLPPGVPPGMWQLYPEIVGNGGAVQSGPPTLPNGQPALVPSSAASNSTVAPKGCTACPVPPGVNPAIVTLYPPNLMQLIQAPTTLPNIQLPPMARPLLAP